MAVLNAKINAYFYLVNIYFSVLLLDLFICSLHRVYSGHSIPQILGYERSRLHVEGLLLKLSNLALVHLLLLEGPQCSLLNGAL